jgi:hypothetical protein
VTWCRKAKSARGSGSDIETSSLKDLKDRSSNLRKRIKSEESGSEFWLSVMKASPYVWLSAISVSGIVVLSEQFQKNWMYILIPLIIILFVFVLGLVARSRVSRSNDELSNDEIEWERVDREIQFRLSAIREWFQNLDYEWGWKQFELPNYGKVNNLPNIWPSDEERTILGKLNKEDVKNEFPVLTRHMEEAIESENKYDDVLKMFHQKMVTQISEINMKLKADVRLESIAQHIGLAKVLLNLYNEQIKSPIDPNELHRLNLSGQDERDCLSRVLGKESQENPWPLLLKDDELKRLGIDVQANMVAVRDKRFELNQRIITTFVPTKKSSW